MFRRNAKLRVWANPYAALDEFGNPANAVATDPTHELGGFVGAKLVKNPEISVESYAKGDPRYPVSGLKFEFDAGAIELPQTHYYLQQIERGNLFAADAETAKAAGVKFVEQGIALGASKAAAVAKFIANYGEKPPFAGEEG